MVTLKDIANKAKVSSATVSRVLNLDENISVSDATRKNIFKIAKELGYSKHQKKTISDKKTTIALIQWYSEQEELNDLYYYSIRIGIEKKAQELGFEIYRFFSGDYSNMPPNISGIIAVGKFSHQQIITLENFSQNIIFVDHDTLNLGHSCIVTDFDHSVENVINYFLSKKIYKIGMIAGEEKTTDQLESLIDKRFRSFKLYAMENGIYNPNYIYIGEFSSLSGYQLMKQAIEELDDNLPPAFFIANDTLAIGALRALQEANISIPEQVKIISFNDTPLTQQVYPSLSSVAVNTEYMGMLSVEQMDILLNNPNRIPTLTKLNAKLNLRESTL